VEEACRVPSLRYGWAARSDRQHRSKVRTVRKYLQYQISAVLPVMISKTLTTAANAGNSALSLL
jgi:hypothetical protein